MKLHTIGYEGTGFKAFITTLHRAGVKLVIDVRDLPLSRRAGFSKTPLSASLATEGVGYVHIKPLGTPKEGRIANKQHDWEKFWDIVDTQLHSPPAMLAFEHAVKLASTTPSALLCFERNHDTCHRLRVAEEMAARHPFEIVHLEVEDLDA